MTTMATDTRLRQCTVCGESKPLTLFPRNGKDKLGKTRYRTDCKTCYNITRKLTKNKAVSKFLNNTMHRTNEVGTYNLDDWRDVMLYFRGACCYCGQTQSRGKRLTRDHGVAVSKGGPTARWNILPACGRCNRSKSNDDLEAWYKKQPFYSSNQLGAILEWMNNEQRV